MKQKDYSRQIRESVDELAGDARQQLKASIPEAPKIGRPPVYELAMTPAERQRRSRVTMRESIHAEADLAGSYIAEARREASRLIGGTSADEKLLSAIDALDRLRDMVRR